MIQCTKTAGGIKYMKDLFKGMGIGFGIGLFLTAGIFIYLLFQKPTPAAVPESSVQEMSQTTEDIPPTAEQEPVQPAAPPEEEPKEDELSSEEEELPGEAVISFAGDVQFPEQYLAAYDSKGIQAIADDEMLAYMQDSDLFFLNEEFPFSLRGEPMPDKQYTFRTDPKYVKIFQDLGTDIVSIANNHALDFGEDAFCDTLETLKEADITGLGGGYNISEASAPAIRTIQGQTFAFLAATRVSPSYSWYATDSTPGMFQTYDPARLNEAIRAADQTCDHVIVFLHWGIERNQTPEEYQRTLARGYIDAGADMVIGCHPHVLQGFEYYNGVPIAYSLGNYLFGSRTGETVLLQAVFSPDRSMELKLIPCQRQNGVLSRIQEPSSLYQQLTSLSFDASVTEDGVVIPFP